MINVKSIIELKDLDSSWELIELIEALIYNNDGYPYRYHSSVKIYNEKEELGNILDNIIKSDGKLYYLRIDDSFFAPSKNEKLEIIYKNNIIHWGKRELVVLDFIKDKKVKHAFKKILMELKLGEE